MNSEFTIILQVGIGDVMVFLGATEKSQPANPDRAAATDAQLPRGEFADSDECSSAIRAFDDAVGVWYLESDRCSFSSYFDERLAWLERFALERRTIQGVARGSEHRVARLPWAAPARRSQHQRCLSGEAA